MVDNDQIFEDIVVYRRVYNSNKTYFANQIQNIKLSKVICSRDKI